ncbi:hypothetical protein FM104_04250 [Microbacterium esteraromaticum]|uniref:Uncharacterized protein n=1 Tax=Microbacterium esteraromaticum TaxID=57043 RepID=A0A1R4IW31_9MICO|nr:hypothetical protein FM104_04250 [Microbacterium esteraromaticum]
MFDVVNQTVDAVDGLSGGTRDDRSSWRVSRLIALPSDGCASG